MAGGRPPKFETPEELQEAIEQYIKKRGNEEKPITMSGMAYELGFASRQSLYDYGNKDEFSYTITRARLLIEDNYEQCLHNPQTCNGAKFALAAGFGWKEKKEITHSGNMQFTGINVTPPTNEDV